MAIRMTDDDPSGGDRDERPRRRASRGGSSGGGGGGGGLSAFLSLLGLMIRWPKTSLVLLIVFGAFVYFGDDPVPAAESEHATGATLDPEVYDQALVYEPMAEGPPEEAERVSLLDFAPRRLSQGQQGSCVGWATSYGARTILHARQTGMAPDEVAFSPSFLYNQIRVDDACNGSHIVRALELMQQTGALPFGDFDYDEGSCTRLPSREQKSSAGSYRIAGFTRLSLDADDYRNNAEAIKQNLRQGAPVVIGMRVGGSFKKLYGKKLWEPTQSDFDTVDKWGGHAMTVVGFDEVFGGGAFQVMNSWGSKWGDDGVVWIRYSDFDFFVREAYGLYPMGEARREVEEQRIRFGLVKTGSFDRIPLKRIDELVYRSVSPLRKGDRFKVEFSNTRPVHTYILGQENDGTSYVLFPYTEKHSPYCGTTGTRIFPRKQSLTVDEVGTRDSIAVVISAKPLDVNALNEKVSRHPGASYAAKLRGALGPRLSSGARVQTVDSLVELASREKDEGKVHALVLEFDKR